MDNLDPLLHSQLRLAIVSLLVKHSNLDFKHIKEKTEATSGNLSVQIKKLEEAGYIAVKKEFKDNFPNTNCKLTSKGLSAFESYVNSIKKYLEP